MLNYGQTGECYNNYIKNLKNNTIQYKDNKFISVQQNTNENESINKYYKCIKPSNDYKQNMLGSSIYNEMGQNKYLGMV